MEVAWLPLLQMVGSGWDINRYDFVTLTAFSTKEWKDKNKIGDWSTVIQPTCVAALIMSNVSYCTSNSAKWFAKAASSTPKLLSLANKRAASYITSAWILTSWCHQCWYQPRNHWCCYPPTKPYKLLLNPLTPLYTASRGLASIDVLSTNSSSNAT